MTNDNNDYREDYIERENRDDYEDALDYLVKLFSKMKI